MALLRCLHKNGVLITAPGLVRVDLVSRQASNHPVGLVAAIAVQGPQGVLTLQEVTKALTPQG